jgi:hypothetical protein
VRFTVGADERVALIDGIDPDFDSDRLRAALPAAAAEIIDIRPATMTELLLGRPGAAR